MPEGAYSHSALHFDKPLKMDGSLAEIFFSKHSKKFSMWVEGEHRVNNAKNVWISDSQNNHIQVNTLNSLEIDRYISKAEWLAKSKSERASILTKTASTIEESAELFAQIEYLMRGILPKDTKHSTTKIAEYFSYYSNLTQLFNTEDKLPKDSCTIILQDLSPLLALAAAAQCFASGRCVKLFVHKNVSAVGILFAELCHLAGISPGLLTVCPVDDKPSECLMMENDHQDNSFSKLNNLHSGTIMAVFESCDIDSAVDVVINGAWSHKGMLPWALKRILVQENIYEYFVEKLSRKIKQFKWHLPEEYNPDDCTKKIIEKVEGILEKATQEGIKHIPMHPDFSSPENKLFAPVVLLDNVSPYFWTDSSDKLPTPVITTQSFRTTKEALSIINNTFSFSLSIWCDNISICNEASLGSNVNYVWINSFGIFKSDVSIKNRHTLNSPFLGGVEGFLCNYKAEPNVVENLVVERKVTWKLQKNLPLKSEIEKATKAQAAWALCKNEKKMLCLLKIATNLENKQENWISWQTNEFNVDRGEATEMLNKAIKYLQFAATFCAILKNECVINTDKTMCLRIREALGVIFIDDKSNHIHNFAFTVAAATLFGNAVLYKTNSDLIMRACKEFYENGLPVFPVTEDYDTKTEYEMIKATWKIGYESPSTTPKMNNSFMIGIWNETQSEMACNVLDENILKMRLSNEKNIWSTFGESFAN